jgi:hypothetical protein
MDIARVGGRINEARPLSSTGRSSMAARGPPSQKTRRSPVIIIEQCAAIADGMEAETLSKTCIMRWTLRTCNGERSPQFHLQPIGLR